MARIVLDSPCWLGVFDGSSRAALYQKSAAQPADLVVPVITLCEVHASINGLPGVNYFPKSWSPRARC